MKSNLVDKMKLNIEDNLINKNYKVENLISFPGH